MEESVLIYQGLEQAGETAIWRSRNIAVKLFTETILVYSRMRPNFISLQSSFFFFFF